MKQLALCLLALFLLALIACETDPVPEQSPVPETLALADFDLSAVSAVEIYSGITGKIQRFTEIGTINALLETLRPIEGDNPISGRGYYATFYGLTLYAADDAPILELSLVKPSDHQHFVGHGVYETINGFNYSALYTVGEAQFDAILALCDSLMGVVPITAVPAPSTPLA